MRSACPNCGAWAEVPDGTFNVVNDTIEILTGSGLTRARLVSLAAILNQARAGDMPTAAAVEAVASEAPSLKPLIERYGPKMQSAFVFFLWSVIQILLAQGLTELRDDSATENDVRRAVEQAIQEQNQPRSRSAAARGSPTKRRPPDPPRKQRQRANRGKRGR